MEDNKNIIAMFNEPNKVKLIKNSMPATEEEYVNIEYLYCGICGGDYSVYRGYRQSYSVSLGHEFVARVISVGQSVKNIHPGQYVVSDFNYRCNECIYCKTNRSHLCIKNDIGLFSNRGFAPARASNLVNARFRRSVSLRLGSSLIPASLINF